MNTYKVIWAIDLWADSPLEAAKQALGIQRDPESRALVFQVIPENADEEVIDLEIEPASA